MPAPPNASRATGGARTIGASLLVLACLLVLPLMAVQRLHLDWRWVAAYGLAVNVVAYLAYACDKRCAQAGEWRVSEAQLHLLELLGGWPGAFLAQRRLRHKCSKNSFQFVFWLIVLAYQFAAFDSLQNWQLSRAVLNRIEQSSNHHR
jgi:uncharacterized membrane protein YsdA (DUF1294 family)